jgi:hypothetical protein
MWGGGKDGLAHLPHDPKNHLCEKLKFGKGCLKKSGIF